MGITKNRTLSWDKFFYKYNGKSVTGKLLKKYGIKPLLVADSKSLELVMHRNSAIADLSGEEKVTLTFPGRYFQHTGYLYEVVAVCEVELDDDIPIVINNYLEEVQVPATSVENVIVHKMDAVETYEWLLLLNKQYGGNVYAAYAVLLRSSVIIGKNDTVGDWLLMNGSLWVGREFASICTRIACGFLGVNRVGFIQKLIQMDVLDKEQLNSILKYEMDSERNIGAVRLLLEQGADVQALYMPILMLAVEVADMAVFKRIFNKGLFTSESIFKLVWRAVRYGRTEFVKYIMDTKSECFSLTDCSISHYFHLLKDAAYTGDKELVSYILENGIFRIEPDMLKGCPAHIDGTDSMFDFIQELFVKHYSAV